MKQEPKDRSKARRVYGLIVAGLAAHAVIVGCASVGQGESAASEAQLTSWTAPLPAEAAGDESYSAESARGLVSAGLQRLDAAYPGGPDQATAGRFFLQAAEAADAEIDPDLRRACFGSAARASLRASDRGTYVRAVDGWESVASFKDHQGDLALHLVIRARLRGEDYPDVRLPSHAAKLIRGDR